MTWWTRKRVEVQYLLRRKGPTLLLPLLLLLGTFVLSVLLLLRVLSANPSVPALPDAPLAPSVPMSKPITADVASLVPSIVTRHMVQSKVAVLKSFTHCRELNRARFSRTIELLPLGASAAEAKLTDYQYAEFIDGHARKAMQAIIQLYGEQFEREELRRYACYMAAEGNNELVNIAPAALLQQVDIASYFGERIPAYLPPKPTAAGAVKAKPKYGVAFLLMVHGRSQKQDTLQLLKLLDDGSALILVHVDKKADEFYAGLAEELARHPSPNIHLAKQRFDGIWGHSSIVNIQMSGFFELLDLGEWGHVINLSGEDFPMRASEDIARTLQEPRYVGKNLIQHWDSPMELVSRILVPVLATVSRAHYEQSFLHAFKMGVRALPIPSWHITKHHQWMVLARDFVEHLRVDPQVARFLAFSEHASFPDEFFFSVVITNNKCFSERLINADKRYTRFGNSAHPERLSMQDSPNFPASRVPGEEVRDFFIRKLVAGAHPDFVQWILTNHVERNRGHPIVENPDLRQQV